MSAFYTHALAVPEPSKVDKLIFSNLSPEVVVIVASLIIAT